MLMSTTHGVDGKPVSRYLGVVTGEAIIGANIFRDMFAAVRDIVGGRSATYEKALNEAREVALTEMQRRAEQLGANAVIGIDVDYEVLGQNNGMLMVAVSGTAVVCWSRQRRTTTGDERLTTSRFRDQRHHRVTLHRKVLAEHVENVGLSYGVDPLLARENQLGIAAEELRRLQAAEPEGVLLACRLVLPVGGLLCTVDEIG
jgi:uncharacterized protein YbjQ (UPF0145 family)